MAEEPENLMLVMLRRLDQRMERMEFDLHDIKLRMTGVEEGIAGVNRRLDRLETRVDRIEQRLNLAEPTH